MFVYLTGTGQTVGKFARKLLDEWQIIEGRSGRGGGNSLVFPAQLASSQPDARVSRLCRKRSYYARFERNRRIVIGKVDTLSPDEARARCQKILGNAAHGLHPLHGIQGTDGMTLGMFIADAYTTWVNASRPRTASNTLEKLYRLFRTWYAEPLTTITVERIESWKARRLNEGRSPTTVLRDLFTLSSVLRRAVKAGELTDNPVRRVDKPRIDRRVKVRFLDQAEEARLRKAMKVRDEELQTLRTTVSANYAAYGLRDESVQS